MGFAPVNNAAISILVVLDSPVGAHHGGEVGGPVFKRIAEQVLAYRDEPHDVPAPTDLETAQNEKASRPGARRDAATDSAEARFQAAAAQTKQPTSAATTVAFGDPNAGAVVVPGLTGQSVRAVTEQCMRLGLVPSLIGSGMAVEQAPAAGAQVMRGSQVTVRFGRAGEIVPVSTAGGGN